QLSERLVARVLATLAFLDQPALADPAALAVAHDPGPLGEFRLRFRRAFHRLVRELVHHRRLEIGARLLDQPLAELVAQQPPLYLLDVPLRQVIELEWAVG